MKLKHLPSDFQVTECPNVAVQQSGPFSLYRLQKTDRTTFNAIALVAKHWQIDADRIAFGGLKDRYAITTQHFTILNGPEKSYHIDGLDVEHIGYTYEEFNSDQITSNRFDIIIRDVTTAEVDDMSAKRPRLVYDGVANYFDDQRFGSVSASGRFVARELVQGNAEEAVRIALTEPLDHHTPADRTQCTLIVQSWGDWKRILKQLPKSITKDVILALAQTGNFVRAFTSFPANEQQMMLAAWQSHLWNLSLDCWIRTHATKQAAITLKTGTVHMPTEMDSAAVAIWNNLHIPYISKRLTLDLQAPWGACVQEVMTREHIQPQMMEIPHRKRPFFSSGFRPAKVTLQDLTLTTTPDDLHPNRHAVRLQFELPSGAYATMAIKQLTNSAIRLPPNAAI